MEVCLFRAGCELATWQKILDSGMILPENNTFHDNSAETI